MSTNSKRIKITPDILLEYVFDSNNFRAENYKVLTNLKEKTKSYSSETSLNSLRNSLFLVDPILSKYSPVNTNNFNFLRTQDFFTSPILNDKLKIYFPSGFDFLPNQSIGFYVNVYTLGQGTNTKYSLTNFYYIIDNINTIDIFTLNTPFYFDEKFWVKSIELEFPSLNSISQDRIVTGISNSPTPDSINNNLTYGEGLSTNTPIFIDFSFITSAQKVMNVDYYYTGDIYSVSLPQTPEFTELGVTIKESNQGDFYEIYGTFLGSNENMDDFAYNQEILGTKVQLQYIVNLYEENILTTTQTYQVTDDFTKKILYRPVIQFSNTTAAIDVELRIVNVMDNSYISKFGSIGITNSLNKYGLRLTRLDVDSRVINTKIYNLKVKNSMNGGAIAQSFIDVMRVPYPVMVDRYRILTKTTNASMNTNDYVPNGLLEILITSFDNVIEFNIAQDINTEGEPVPYDLSTISTNSNLKLVFKSDSEKLEKEPFYQADNNYELGNISYKILERDYKVLRRIYDKGYDNFYLVVSANGVNTQLYSGKFMFYEDVTFIKEAGIESTGTTGILVDTTVVTTDNIDDPQINVDRIVTENNPFIKTNMDSYEEDPNVDKNYINLLIYVRFQTNIDKMDEYLKKIGITPEIKYGNVYFLKRVYYTTVSDIKLQGFIEKVFEIPISTGAAPKKVVEDPKVIRDREIKKTVQVFSTPPPSPTRPVEQPYSPARPNISLDRSTIDDINTGRRRGDIDQEMAM